MMNLVGIKVTSNIDKIARDFNKEVTGFLDAHSQFLDSRKEKIYRLAYLTTKRVVYGTPFKPTYYVRTFNLLNSIYVEKILSQKSLTNYHEIMSIASNAMTAQALGKNTEGGYPKFVAGEGNGATEHSGGFKIGFLRTIYNKKASYFPRPFHDYIFTNVRNYLFSEYDRSVLSKLK